MQKMINAFKTFRTQSPALIFSTPLPPPPPGLGRKASGVRFKQTTTLRSSESDSEHNMDKPEPNPTEKNGDSLSHSFGEGNATRCDDDGFGVVYGGIRSVPKTEEDENHPAVDKSQGSEVQEKQYLYIRDSLSHSFGEGYATRCDDDGFGVVYGGIRSVPKTEEDENHPAVDKSQGSEVQEKEKARHQTDASS